MSWLTNITSSEGVTGFLKNIESKLDQVLDVAPTESKDSKGNSFESLNSETPVSVSHQNQRPPQTQQDFFTSIFGSPSPLEATNNATKQVKVGNFKDKLDSRIGLRKVHSSSTSPVKGTLVNESLSMPMNVSVNVNESVGIQDSLVHESKDSNEPNDRKQVIQESVNGNKESNESDSLQKDQESIQETLKEPTSPPDISIILEQRESQLVKVMQDNASLNESLLVYKSKELQDLDKIQSLEIQIQEFQKLNSQDLTFQLNQLHSALKEKDLEIIALREEGERLSKLELKNNSSLKKLVSKNNELDKSVKECERKLESLSSENADLKSKLTKSSDLEKRQSESIKSLSNSNVTIKKEAEKLQLESDLNFKKVQELTLLYDQSIKELKQIQDTSNEERVTTLNLELDQEKEKNSTLETEITTLKSTLNQIELDYRKEMSNLRGELQRCEEEKGWKEDSYRKELSALQNRLLESDSRQEELSMMSHESTKPLLRQIEALQSQYQNSLQEWGNFEKR